MQHEGQSSAFLIVNALEAAPGSDPTTFGGGLQSDVITVVNDVPTVFNDVGRVSFSLALKDPGSADHAVAADHGELHHADAVPRAIHPERRAERPGRRRAVRLRRRA